MSTIDNLPPLRDVIHRYELNAKKSLGQNFILDLNITAKIAKTCLLYTSPSPRDLSTSRMPSSA